MRFGTYTYNVNSLQSTGLIRGVTIFECSGASPCSYDLEAEPTDRHCALPRRALQVRTRGCTAPAPAHGGLFCAGDATEDKECNALSCLGEGPVLNGEINSVFLAGHSCIQKQNDRKGWNSTSSLAEIAEIVPTPKLPELLHLFYFLWWAITKTIILRGSHFKYIFTNRESRLKYISMELLFNARKTLFPMALA